MLDTETDKGRLGEYLVCLYLERHGIETVHADRSGSDIWCRRSCCGEVFTVQVKSASKPVTPTPKIKGSYRFHFPKTVHPQNSATFNAFVALDHELILFGVPRPVVTQTFPPNRFTPANQSETFIATIGEHTCAR